MNWVHFANKQIYVCMIFHEQFHRRLQILEIKIPSTNKLGNTEFSNTLRHMMITISPWRKWTFVTKSPLQKK